MANARCLLRNAGTLSANTGIREQPFDSSVIDNLLSLFDGYRLKHAPAQQDSGSKQAALELLQQLESEISRW